MKFILLLSVLVSTKSLIGSDTITISKAMSPFTITDSLIYVYDQVVVVEAGVEIIFEDESLLVVNGGLECNGTEEEPIYLRGPENGWVRIKAPNEKSAISFNFVEAYNISVLSYIRPFTLENCKFYNTRNLEWNQSIITSHGGTMEINSCYFEGNKTGEGCIIHNSENPIVINNVFDKVPDAVEFIKCNHGIIKDNIIKNGMDDGIDLNGCHDVQIENNVIQNMHDKGMEIGPSNTINSTDILIKNNVISKVHAGIHLMENTKAKLENNSIKKTKTKITFSNPQDSIDYAKTLETQALEKDEREMESLSNIFVTSKALIAAGVLIILSFLLFIFVKRK